MRGGGAPPEPRGAAGTAGDRPDRGHREGTCRTEKPSPDAARHDTYRFPGAHCRMWNFPCQHAP